jgi:hypothetical protein
MQALLSNANDTRRHAEEYLKQARQDDGTYANANPIEIKERAVFITFADAETHQTAIEKLDDHPAEEIARMLDNLLDIKRVNLPKAQLSQAKDTSQTKKADDGFDMDIPF